MQLRHIKHADIDFEKWDQVILDSELPVVFAQSFYLCATCPEWDALVIGDYETIFPLTHKKKFGFFYLPQPPFTSQLGAFGNITNERLKLFFDYIFSHYKLIEIELNQLNHFHSEHLTIKHTFFIDYKTEIIYNQNTKRNISKAIRLGLKVKEIFKNDILKLSHQYLNPFLSEQFGLSKSTLGKFEQLLKNAMTQNLLRTFAVYDSEDQLRAIGHFICNEKHILFLKGTNFDRKDNTGSMHYLIDFAINFYKDKALFFDFGGGFHSKGLADFYKGLGGQKFNYSCLKYNHLPKLLKFLTGKN